MGKVLTDCLYYHEEGPPSITIYHGDCLELLPLMPEALVITDPPYGIDFQGEGYTDLNDGQYQQFLGLVRNQPVAILQYPEDMMRLIVPVLGAPDEVFTWVYNSNTARQTRLFGFWNYKPDFVLVKVPCKNPNDPRVNQMVSSYDWSGDFQQVKNVSIDKTEHPCQVPTGLMKRILNISPDNMVVDPFAGSGTTLVACKELGRNAIGIEISEKYCQIAKTRLQNTIVPFL